MQLFQAAHFIILNSIHMWRRTLVNVFCFSPQAINQAGAGPYSELVTCRIPASVPDAVSTLCVLEDEHVSSCQPSPSVCLVLSWEEPSNNGAEITSYNIDLGELSIPVGNVTSHVIEGLLPETSYRWVLGTPHSSASLWECSGHGNALKTAQTTSLGAQESPAFLDGMDCGSSSFLGFFSLCITSVLSFLSHSAKVRLHW